MTIKTSRFDCDPTSLQRLLDGKIEAAEESILHDHLESCEGCRERLNRLAEGEWSWQDASKFFVDDDLDCEVNDSIPLGEEEKAGHSGGASVDAILMQLDPTDDPAMLGRFGGYEIAGVVGCGGMGVVLKGFDVSLNRYVAIKILAPHLAVSGPARKRFAREGQATASVIHPNVVPIHQVAESHGHPFLVMPYLGSRSLQRYITDSGPLAIASILRVGLQIAHGLAAAHAQGLVHRDIKPGNILLDKDVHRIVITDFGLARTVDDASLTKTGVLAGTPQYMSPEQARGDHVDHRSDLFSLGSVMYAMSTGHPPFRAETSYGILRRITDQTPRPIRETNAGIPPWLCQIIDRLHAKSPEDRYQSASEVAEVLQQCLVHVETPNSPLPRNLQANSTTRPTRLPYLIVATGIVFLLAATAWFFDADLAPKTVAEPAFIPAGKTIDSDSVGPLEDDTLWIDPLMPRPSEIRKNIVRIGAQIDAIPLPQEQTTDPNETKEHRR